ncbi:circadian clock protein LdpA [Leptothermofonsia sp. ETS-13]|uniref:circadian clock protein LdpA n=1 Tax=Leptothermofonsia sp. ETS-13 TaxID=3035696 RepID=UPI003BA14DB7
MTELYYPLQSLREGHWFKLICGASFQHLPAIRNLVLAYTLAGADCIDVAADPAVISTAKAALKVAKEIGAAARERGFRFRSLPWLMVSFNDGEDPHFRKAEFRAEECPPDCLRPCEAICPAQAIDASGVISDRCYGCGRCLAVCPIQQITARSYVSTPAAIAPFVLQSGIDAIEIHTQVGRLENFRRLWEAIAPWISHLKLVAISCPDGDELIDYLRSLYEIISPLPCTLVWQADGRPMSGDIGIGATRAATKLGQKVLAAKLPGYIQLAGGTNHHTVPKLKRLGLLPSSLFPHPQPLTPSSSPQIAGVAYGSYARTLLAPILNQLEAMEMEAFSNHQKPQLSTIHSPDTARTALPVVSPMTQIKSQPLRLEEVPSLLWQAVELADSLVSQLKSPANT